jgi:hypothetical protein
MTRGQNLLLQFETIAKIVFICLPWDGSVGFVWQEIHLYGKINSVQSITKDKAEVTFLRNFPEQDGTASGGGRAAGIITTLLLFLLIISVAFFSYQRSLDPSIGMREAIKALSDKEGKKVRDADVLYSFSFDSRETTVFAPYKELLVKCSKSGIMFLDKNGSIVSSESLSYANPMLKTNGDQLLAADIDATELCIFDDISVSWQDKTDTAILNADISQNGYVTVITSAKRDNNTIRVYEPHGVELFRKIIANDFAVSACVSPSKKYLTLSAISTGAVGPFSRYKFYDMEGKELAGLSFDASGELLPLFWYNRDDSLFAAGDSAAGNIGRDGKLVWQENFTRVAGAGPAGNGMLAVAAQTEEGAYLNIYAADGSKHASTELQITPAGLEAIRGRICVYNENTVFFFDEKGNNTSKYNTGKRIRQVCLFSKTQAAVITDGEVTVLGIY